MKNLFFTTMALLLLSTGAKAQNPVQLTPLRDAGTPPAPPVQKPAQNFAQFHFAEPDNTHDFGNIPEGPKVSYTFTFTNSGNEPLIISNAQASCGCTSPEFSKEPVLPGKNGKITVTYATENRPGNFTKSIYISSNARAENGSERYELFIKGNVLPAKKP